MYCRTTAVSIPKHLRSASSVGSRFSSFPNGSLASDVVGFTTNDNVGTYGLEEFYNDELCGINGDPVVVHHRHTDQTGRVPRIV